MDGPKQKQNLHWNWSPPPPVKPFFLPRAQTLSPDHTAVQTSSLPFYFVGVTCSNTFQKKSFFYITSVGTSCVLKLPFIILFMSISDNALSTQKCIEYRVSRSSFRYQPILRGKSINIGLGASKKFWERKLLLNMYLPKFRKWFSQN